MFIEHKNTEHLLVAGILVLFVLLAMVVLIAPIGLFGISL